jgi:hypothetical protein
MLNASVDAVVFLHPKEQFNDYIITSIRDCLQLNNEKKRLLIVKASLCPENKPSLSPGKHLDNLLQFF